MEQDQTQTKTQEPKPDQVNICTLPRSVRILCGFIRLFNTLKMSRTLPSGVHISNSCLCTLPRCVRIFETDPQNHPFSIPVSISHMGELTMVSKGFQLWPHQPPHFVSLYKYPHFTISKDGEHPEKSSANSSGNSD